MSTTASVLAALAAAAMFGTASVFQHDEAQAAGVPETGHAVVVTLLRRLVRRRRWRWAVTLAAASFGVQAVALAFGPLVLVQPLAATDLLFAMAILAARRRAAAEPTATGTRSAVPPPASRTAPSPPADARPRPSGPQGADHAAHRAEPWTPAHRAERWTPTHPDRRRATAHRAQWWGASLVCGGVAGFLALVPSGAGTGTPSASAWTPVLIAVAVVVVGTSVLATRAGTIVRTVLLATAGAADFALVDALTKSVVGWFEASGITALLQWEPYALLGAGLLGTMLAQRAYQAGPLIVSLPVIDTVEPVAAVAIGATVFAEPLARSPGLLAAQLVAACAAAIGIVVVDRSLAWRSPRRPEHPATPR